MGLLDDITMKKDEYVISEVKKSAKLRVPDSDQAVETAEPEEGSSSGKSAKERLMEVAVSVRHLMTHLPKNPYCLVCQAGKLVKVHHRRRIPNEDNVIEFWQRCTADTLYAHGAR